MISLGRRRRSATILHGIIAIICLLGIDAPVFGQGDGDELRRQSAQIHAELSQEEINAFNISYAMQTTKQRETFAVVNAIIENTGHTLDEQMFRAHLQKHLVPYNGNDTVAELRQSLRQGVQSNGTGGALLSLFLTMSEVDSREHTKLAKSMSDQFVNQRIFKGYNPNDSVKFLLYVQKALTGKPASLALLQQLANGLHPQIRWNDPKLHPVIEKNFLDLKSHSATQEKIDVSVADLRKFIDTKLKEATATSIADAVAQKKSQLSAQDAAEANLKRYRNRRNSASELRAGAEIASYLAAGKDAEFASDLLDMANTVSSVMDAQARFESPIPSEKIGGVVLASTYVGAFFTVASIMDKKVDVDALRFQAIYDLLLIMQKQLEVVDTRVIRLTKLSVDSFDKLLRAAKDQASSSERLLAQQKMALAMTQNGIELQYRLAEQKIERRLMQLRESCFRPLLYAEPLPATTTKQCLVDLAVSNATDAVSVHALRTSNVYDEQAVLSVLASLRDNEIATLSSVSLANNALALALDQPFAQPSHYRPTLIVPHLGIWRDLFSLQTTLLQLEKNPSASNMSRRREMIAAGQTIRLFTEGLLGSSKRMSDLDAMRSDDIKLIAGIERELWDDLDRQATAAQSPGLAVGRALDDGLAACEAPTPNTSIHLKEEKSWRAFVPKSFWMLEILGLGSVGGCYRTESWLSTLEDDEYLHTPVTNSSGRIWTKIDISIELYFQPLVPLAAYDERAIWPYTLSDDEAQLPEALLKVTAASSRGGENFGVSHKGTMDRIPIAQRFVRSDWYHDVGPITADNSQLQASVHKWVKQLFDVPRPCTQSLECFNRLFRVDGQNYPVLNEGGANLDDAILAKDASATLFDGALGARWAEIVAARVLSSILNDQAKKWHPSTGAFVSENEDSIAEMLWVNAWPGGRTDALVHPVRSAGRVLATNQASLFAEWEKISANISRRHLAVSGIAHVRDFWSEGGQACLDYANRFKLSELLQEVLTGLVEIKSGASLANPASLQSLPIACVVPQVSLSARMDAVFGKSAN